MAAKLRKISLHWGKTVYYRLHLVHGPVSAKLCSTMSDMTMVTQTLSTRTVYFMYPVLGIAWFSK